MFVSRFIFNSLEKFSENFNKNHSIVVDFLFYVFDRFSLEEKQTILKNCPLMKDNEKINKDQLDQKDTIDNNLFSEEIKIDIHPLLEERLVNLILECEKLQTISDALEFLVFICDLLEKDLLKDLIIQYSIESVHMANFAYMDEANPLQYELPNPFHNIPSEPDRTELLLYN